MIKPNTSEYRLLHYWVENNLGKPMICSICGVENKTRYHWANLSGEYKKDITDWIRLCVQCHMKKDKSKEVCHRGHVLTKDNVVIRNKNPFRTCRICKNLLNRRYRNKNKDRINYSRRKANK